MTEVRAGWALHGKPRDSHEDYTIMASGGFGFTDGDLMLILSRYSLGNPPADRDSPGSLPWVAINEARDGEITYVGLTVQEWSNDPDGAGRPIAHSRYFAVPYQALCAEAISYQDLYHTLRRAPLPSAGAPMRIELSATKATEQARSIAALGFARVATAAAMSLEGPVTVTRCPELRLEERLTFLDAVAALLPYGWRTEYSAGTWHEGGSKHVRLAFARHNRANSFELDWLAPAGPPARADIAGTYLQRLRELTGGGSGEEAVARVIGHLRLMTGPVNGPEDAIRSLNEFDWHLRVLKAARQGHATRADLRRMFNSEEWRLLESQEDRVLVFGELIDAADREDIPLITRVWNEVAADHRTPFDRLVHAGAAALCGPDPDRDTSAYVAAAETLGIGDRYLAAVLEGGGTTVHARSLAVAAAQVKRRLDTDHAETFEAVVRDIPLAFALITELLDRPEDLSALVEQLKTRLPVPMGSFDAVLTGPGVRISECEIEQLAAYGANCLYDYLRVAAAYERLGLVLPAFVGWLVGQARIDAAFWGSRLAGLERAGATEQGVIDALLLGLRSGPRHLRFVGQAEQAAYRAGFLEVLRLSSSPLRARVLDGLARHLETWTWPAEPDSAALVLSLSAAVGGDGEAGGVTLARVVAAGRALDPRLSANPEYAGWWATALREDPPLRSEAPLIALRALRRSADPKQVAMLCAEGYLAGTTAGQICEALRVSEWHPTGEELLWLLRQTRMLHPSAPVHSERMDEWLRDLLRVYIADDVSKAGPRAEVTLLLLREMDFHLGLLDCVVPGGHSLGEEAREGLKEAAQRIKNLAAEGGWRLWRR
ncbi:hypothetical protein B0I32_105416 [Nonomuraea fuscirosea]|uniref:Uncharacterized protein n=1 Tax=Nonomuraea fuscirosea TaxID=1291556 RepID=A0A2T0N495_9ACTN|nr:hypothetical protein [Nonomuraea fuscirosea]PRX66976.1 hypothetical protein B0I32_105416 [Nonomuraea fuscirosea]